MATPLDMCSWDTSWSATSVNNSSIAIHFGLSGKIYEQKNKKKKDLIQKEVTFAMKVVHTVDI